MDVALITFMFGSPRLRTTLLVTAVALCSSACLEKCAPGKVGNGLARLTVRSVGGVVQVINEDDVCGFESAAVKSAFELDGAPGQQGCATWTVSGCDLDFGQKGRVTYDCHQTATLMSGRLVVDAQRTICGTVTGDPEQPVVPVGPDGVTITLDRVQFDQFVVEDSSQDAKLTWKIGEISGVAKPRLAASAAEGICMIATPNIEMSEIRYTNALVHLVAEGRAFDVPVETSNITAVNGVHGDRENYLGGTVTVWGGEQEVGDDGDGLNPDYNPASFLEGYACTDGISTPVSFECTNVGPVLAMGAARLTVRNMGAIGNKTEKDTNCGFSSTSVLEGIEILEGSVGEIGAAKFRVENCVIEIPAGSLTKERCDGTQAAIAGRFTVTAEKIMRGRITGDLAQPVVPMDDHPVEFFFERIAFENFHLEDAGTALTQINGAMSARLRPRTAMDTELTACGFETPIAKMWDLQYIEPTDVIVKSPQGRFETTIGSSNLLAVNGSWNGEENLLDGTIEVYGEVHGVPSSASDTGLDPEYDAATFNDVWMCGTVDLQYPFECHFVRPLAQGASQLTAMTLGQVVQMTEADETCGFASDAVRFGTAITGDLGEPGGVGVYSIDTPCRINFDTAVVIDEDCNGKKTFVKGAVNVTGTKTLRGYVSGDPIEPIVPTTRDPAEISLDIDFGNFEIWTEPGDNKLVIFDGNLRGTIRPRTAIDQKTGACSLPTPVVQFEKMIYTNTNMQITSQGRAFNVNVSTSNLSAQNGNRDGVENMINGTIIIDGASVTVPINADEGLDPEYDAAVFTAGYACKPDLEIPADDTACNMMKPLGEGAARLLISALGAATGIVNSDNDCGYSKLGVMMDPDRVEGRPGEFGLMEWELDNCEPGYGDPVEEDCLGREQFASGSFSHTGRRTVEGIREEITILFLSFDSIVPNAHNSVKVVHDAIVFNEFGSYDLDPGADVPARGVTIHSGTMSAVVEPITGRNPDNGYDVPTKVARMTNVIMGPAPITILFEGKTFNVMIDGAELYAFNGSWNGANETNVIEGQISINGTPLVLPRQGLDPDFDQANFDARYACTDGLQETIPISSTPSP